MKTRTRSVASLMMAAAFCCVSATALAMPKAAEDETSEVSSGANAARPKHSSAKPAPLAVKTKPAKKSAKPAKPNISAKKVKGAPPHK